MNASYVRKIYTVFNFLYPSAFIMSQLSQSTGAVVHTDCTFDEGKILPTKASVFIMRLNYLMVRLQFGSLGECEEPLHCHYSSVYSDPEK